MMMKCNNQISYMLFIARMMATSVIWYIISQEATTTMVDCYKGTRDCAKNNQWNLHVTLWE
jgi:hypothetical protein